MAQNNVSCTKTAPAKATTIKLAPQCSSVEIEDIQDKSDHPKLNPPCNPRHILEATDGSNDEEDTNPAPALIDVNDDNDNDNDNEPTEPEKDVEAKLTCSIIFI